LAAESNDELSKAFNELAEHHKALGEHHEESDATCAALHDTCVKAFTKASSHHADLAEAHGAMAEHAKKAIEDALGKTVVGPRAHGVTGDAPDSARVRMVNRVGGAPDQRRENADREKILGSNLDPDTEGIDYELEDLVKGRV
jgi:hypothetical protein